jgi:integrase
VEPAPRNVTIGSEERNAILQAASPSLRCFILLCSDLAIRSGTAVKIAPRNYDREKETISFRTKKGVAMTLPVTNELAELLHSASRCPSDWSFVGFMGVRRRATITDDSMRETFRRLMRNLGMDRGITPHDFRRSTAVNVLVATGDIRAVQAVLGHKRLATTVHYLDHRLTPVSREWLEAAKKGVQ